MKCFFWNDSAWHLCNYEISFFYFTCSRFKALENDNRALKIENDKLKNQLVVIATSKMEAEAQYDLVIADHERMKKEIEE